MASRQSPNIIVTGTPGVGKTSHCEMIAAQSSGLRHMSINEIVKDRGLHEGFDDRFKSFIVDEDKLLDAIEDEVKAGGNIIDWHACDLFPESWIDLVVVLRTDSTELYDRLMARKYSESKLQENMDAEIMQVILSEARESYDKEIIVELQSDSTDDLEANVRRIDSWIVQWNDNNRRSAS